MENKFKERLKELRQEKGLTQKQIADLFGISRISVVYWEQGSEPDYDTLIKLAKFFDVSVDFLLGIED